MALSSHFLILLFFFFFSGLEFAYCRSPRSMQSFVTSLFFVVNGIGALLAPTIILVAHVAGYDFISSEHRESKTLIPYLGGKLDHFFYMMAVLNFVNWILFVIYGVRTSRKRKRRDLERTVAAFIQTSIEDSLRRSNSDNQRLRKT